MAYLVKLNIEMSLANLIARLARSGNRADAYAISNSHSDQRSRNPISNNRDVGLKSFTQATVQADSIGNTASTSASNSSNGIQKRLDYEVKIERGHSRNLSADDGTCSSNGDMEDHISLAHHPGYPRGTAVDKLALPPRPEV